MHFYILVCWRLNTARLQSAIPVMLACKLQPQAPLTLHIAKLNTDWFSYMQLVVIYCAIYCAPRSTGKYVIIQLVPYIHNYMCTPNTNKYIATIPYRMSHYSPLHHCSWGTRIPKAFYCLCSLQTAINIVYVWRSTKYWKLLRTGYFIIYILFLLYKISRILTLVVILKTAAWLLLYYYTNYCFSTFNWFLHVCITKTLTKNVMT